jgi:hypothetical protein
MVGMGRRTGSPPGEAIAVVKTAGTLDYYRTVHRNMTEQIVVTK